MAAIDAWTAQQNREEALLALQRGGSLWLGTGLGGALAISHTTGTDGEGQFASFLILTVENNACDSVTIPIAPDWEGTLPALLASLHYHASEARRLTKERQAAAVPAPALPAVSGADESA